MADDVTRYYQIVDLHALLAAPLVATVEADFMAATKFIQFIEEYGFVPDPAPPTAQPAGRGTGNLHFGSLRMVVFRYYTARSAQTENGTETVYIEHRIEIPALSLIPLPLLQVKDAEFEMDVRILGVVERQPEPALRSRPRNASPMSGYYQQLESTHVAATLAPLNQTGHNELAPNMVANFKSKVRIVQADIPSGISQLINLTQGANQSIETPAKPGRESEP